MTPELTARFLLKLAASRPDGQVHIVVTRSSLLPACTVKVSQIQNNVEVAASVTKDSLFDALAHLDTMEDWDANQYDERCR